MTNLRPERFLLLTAVLAFATISFASGAAARPPGPPDGGARLEGVVDQLGLDESTLAAVDAEIDASRQRGRELRRKLRSEHEAMRALLEADEPDEKTIFAQVDILTGLEAEAQKNRLGTLLRVRALLPLDARERLIELMERHRGQRRDGHPPRGPQRRHAPPTPPGEAG